MSAIEWARANKATFVGLQEEQGFPAIFVAAHHCHEGFNSDGTMSGLFAKDNNGCGLKWAEWQREFGCTPVNYPTSEYLNGKWVEVEDLFCHCDSLEMWLKVYTEILNFDRYKPAQKYKEDPFLFALHIWRGGWATDPNYLAGIGAWITRLWDDYKDTLPFREVKVEETYPAANVEVDGLVVDCGAFIKDGSTYAKVKPIVHALGGRIGWEQATRTAKVSTRHVNDPHGPQPI